MSALLKLFFILAPLVAQGIQQTQDSLGVNHPTIAGQIASWLLAITLSARAFVPASGKDVHAETPGGGA